MPTKLFTLVSLILLVFIVTFSAHAQTLAENWHQFRGPENNGVSRTATPPLEWSESNNLRWKAEIEGHGTSSPIVWGERVFVTTAIDTGEVDASLPKPEDQPERVFGIKHPNTRYEMIVLCYDRRSGRQLWRAVATSVIPHEGHHKDASFASASPFCDGERLYCWFGTAGLFAYSLDGQKIWQRDLGKARVGASLGEGSSPVVHGGRLLLVRDHAGQSTIVCLDAATGETIWKKDRDEGNAWATPAIASHGDRTQIITTASSAVRSYDLATGDILWTATGLTNNSAPCPIVEGDTVYCMTGYKGHALLAIPITGTGDVTDQIRWRADRGTPYVPSPILYDGQLYFTQSNQGILTSLDASDGREVIERTRVPDLGDIYASPVGADGRIYFVGRKGTTVVLEHGTEFRVLATNQLDDNFHASPALAGKQLFLRGMRFLYCLEEGATASPNAKSASPTATPELPTNPKKVLSTRLKRLVDAGKLTGEESVELYLTAFPEEEEKREQMKLGEKTVKLIQSGKFDSAPFEAVDLALKQNHPQARGAALSTAFGRLGGGVGGVKLDVVVEHLESLTDARDKDFAINGLAHGLVSKDPEAAMKWANSISEEGFRKTVVENVTRRIEAHSLQPGKGVGASKE